MLGSIFGFSVLLIASHAAAAVAGAWFLPKLWEKLTNAK